MSKYFLIIFIGIFLAVVFFLSGCGGGSDDKTGSENTTTSTFCDQTITINIDASEDMLEVGDEVETEDGEKVYINKILKVETEGPVVSIDAEVCTSEDNDNETTNRTD